jgi:hypothetical protein
MALSREPRKALRLATTTALEGTEGWEWMSADSRRVIFALPLHMGGHDTDLRAPL